MNHTQHAESPGLGPDGDGPLISGVDSHSVWPAWMLSVVLHATALIACGLLAPVAARPARGEPERIVGIALVPTPARIAMPSNRPDSDSDGGGARSTTREAATAAATLMGQLPTLDQVGREFAAALPQPGAALPDAGAVLGVTGARGVLDDVGATNQSGRPGQTRTQVFGANGTGSKFVYVFDRSASMGGFDGRPLATAKSELIRSLGDLSAIHQFQIVFYNERPSVFKPVTVERPSMLFATHENLQLAREFVAAVSPLGGTRHREALELAIGMSPDVIFFLTDANEPELSPSELADLRRRNRAAAAIHCIEFGVGPATGYENFLMRLAQQHRGQYVYVDVTALGRNP